MLAVEAEQEFFQGKKQTTKQWKHGKKSCLPIALRGHGINPNILCSYVWSGKNEVEYSMKTGK